MDNIEARVGVAVFSYVFLISYSIVWKEKNSFCHQLCHLNGVVAGSHSITKIVLKLKSFSLNHDVVLQWNEDKLVLSAI